MYTFENTGGHVEVYFDGEFQFTADTREEAEKEVREITGRM